MIITSQGLLNGESVAGHRFHKKIVDKGHFIFAYTLAPSWPFCMHNT